MGEIGIKSADPCRIEIELSGQRGATLLQQLMQGGAGDLAVHDPGHLVEPEAQLLDRHDARQDCELAPVV